MTKAEEIVTDILQMIDEELSAEAKAELKDMLMAKHGIDHELVSPDTYKKYSDGKTKYDHRVTSDDAAPRSPVREMQLIAIAKDECRPVIAVDGVAFDSAASVYRKALREIGLDAASIAGTPAANLAGIFRTMRTTQAHANAGASNGVGMALDTCARQGVPASFTKRFPNVAIPRRA